jgi:hypothetical protein
VLSPLSWWNDLYVNLPLAYLAANVAYHVHPRLFLPMFAGAYWFTNLLGLLLLHWGARRAVQPDRAAWSRTEAWRWLLISFVYTAAVVALCSLGVLRPVRDYLGVGRAF